MTDHPGGHPADPGDHVVVRRRRRADADEPPATVAGSGTVAVAAPAEVDASRPPEAVAARRRRRWPGVVLVVVALLAATGAVMVSRRSTSPRPRSTAPAPATALLSARRVPGWTTALMPAHHVAMAVEPIVATAPATTCVGVGDGTGPLYLHGNDQPLSPASNMKILTAAAALDLLGADTTLVTSLRSGVPLAPDGTLTGDLFMVGGGDPLIATEGYQAHPGRDGRPPETDLEAVADKLLALGLRRVTGTVVGDASRYDAEHRVPTWPERFQGDGTVAPISALLVNDGWQVDPVTGTGSGSPAADPAAHAAATLARLLADRGVQFGALPHSGTAPAGTIALLDVPSLPISGVVGEMLAFSDNSTAEMLLKEIGVKAAGSGSTAAGAAAVAKWATDKGYPVTGMNVVDGSGLSEPNRLTCALLAAVLRGAGPSGPLAAGLAVPGKPGTLIDRFGGPEWQARLRAKTGTLNSATALSGWLASRPGATLDFQILENTPGRSVTGADTSVQERVLTALLDQPPAPPLAEAGPVAAPSS